VFARQPPENVCGYRQRSWVGTICQGFLNPAGAVSENDLTQDLFWVSGPRFCPGGQILPGADIASDFSDLAGQVFLHLLPPNQTTGARFVRAFFQAGQLLAPFSN